MALRTTTRPLRVLTFDCEARPLGWIGSDYTHSEITVMSWAWQDCYPTVKALSKDDRSRVAMLKAFRLVYESADIVCGHYIRKFDLPLVNAMLAEAELPGLGSKLVSDTKEDLQKYHGISKSQDNLASMLGIEEDKVKMRMGEWRAANRLTKTGVERAEDRAVFDVIQNQAIRTGLIERGMLGPPKPWRP